MNLSAEDLKNGMRLAKKGGQTLPDRIKEGNVEEILKLVSENPSSVNLQDTKGKTPLHIATEEKNKQDVDILLKHGGDVSLLDLEHKSALHYAIDRNEFEISKSLLDAKASIDTRTNLGQTCLHRAAIKGNLKLVQLLMQYDTTGRSILDDCPPATDEKPAGKTAEMYARDRKKGKDAEEGEAIANYLQSLKAGGPVSTMEMVHDQVMAATVPASNDSQQVTDVANAAVVPEPQSNVTNVQELVEKYHSNMTRKVTGRPIYDLVKNSNFQNLTAALGEKANKIEISEAINEIDTFNGRTSLHYAAELCDVKKLTHLIRFGGIDDNDSLLMKDFKHLKIKDNAGLTPLQISAQLDKKEVELSDLIVDENVTVTSLREKMVKERISFQSALFELVTIKHLNGLICLLELLKSEVDLQKNVSMNYIHPKLGMGALHVAADNGGWYLIPYLIEAGCQLELEDSRGETPLHKACRRGDILSVALLLRAGSIMLATGTLTGGVTPIHLAAQYGHEETLKYMCNLDPYYFLTSLYMKDVLGSTPIDLALISVNKGIAEWFDMTLRYYLKATKAREINLSTLKEKESDNISPEDAEVLIQEAVNRVMYEGPSITTTPTPLVSRFMIGGTRYKTIRC